MLAIRVSGEFYGVHQWPDAPNEVAHLRNLHAHIFGVRVEIEVDHANRDVEFFIARRNLGHVLDAVKGDLMVNPQRSCEMMAKDIANLMYNRHGYRVLEVIVSEPGIGDGIWRTSNQ